MALPEFCTKFAKNLCKPQIDHVIGLAHISDRRRGRRLFRRRDVSDDYFQGTLHGVRDRREPAHESARHPLRFAATARGGGRVARRFLGGRRGVLRRKLLVLYGRLLRRTRSGRFPVGRRPARSGSATVPLRRLLFCPFVGRRRQAPARSLPYLRRYSFFMKFAGRVVGYGTRPGPSQRTKNYEDIPANLARGRLLKTRTPADRTGCSGGKSRRARGPRPLFIGVL